MPRFPLFLMLALLLPSAMVSAEKKFGTFIDEGEPAAPASLQEGKQWEEGQASLPPWPVDGDLVELKLDFRSPGNFRYFIDSRHLRVDADEMHIAPDHGHRPDRCLVTYFDLADHQRRRIDPGARRNLRLGTQIGTKVGHGYLQEVRKL